LAIALPLALSFLMVMQPDSTAEQMAAYLNTHVPTDVVVETWEPELGFLSDHRYHYPPIALLDTAVRHQWLDGPPLVYDGLSDRPEYVVVGGFGSYTNVYAPELLERDYRLVEEIGNYRLFARR